MFELISFIICLPIVVFGFKALNMEIFIKKEKEAESKILIMILVAITTYELSNLILVFIKLYNGV